MVRVKGIGVHHRELTAAHDAVAGTNFVAVFCVDLVERHRKLLVAFQAVADQRGKGFFGRGAYDHVLAAAVLGSEHFAAHLVPASAFFPDFSGLNHSRLHLKAAGLVQFLADYVHHFCKRLKANRHV